MKKTFKFISLVLIIITILSVVLFACSNKKEDKVDNVIDNSINSNATFRIACITDAHSRDKNLKNLKIRDDVITTLNSYANMEIDVLLFGGDLASGTTLTEENNNILLNKFNDEFNKVSSKVLWVTGNHDYSTAHNTYPSSSFTASMNKSLYYKYNSADYYNKFIKTNKNLGEAISVYSEEYNNNNHNNSAAMNYVLGYRYKIDGYNFICLNTHPEDLRADKQRYNYTYTKGTIDWAIEQISSISQDENIFLLAHIPLNDSKGLRKDKGILEDTSIYFRDKLLPFSNVIYLYGHDHNNGKDRDGNETCAYIKYDTNERITQYYKDNGEKSFISCFMGSMSYEITPGVTDTSKKDPTIFQGLIIEIIDGKISLQMKNFGSENGGAFILNSFIVE